MSEERGKLKGAITEIEHIINMIHAKKLALTDHVGDKPRTGHRCNITMGMERRAYYKNSPPPRILPSNENRDALLAFYKTLKNI